MINEADFSALGLSEEMLAAVQAKGFETPTSIQRLTIPRLLSGENDIIAQSQTGTGKSYIAQLTYEYSVEKGILDKKGSFVTVNCAEYANNPELFLTNLFGYKKGSYTGAEKDKAGLLALADGGVMPEQIGYINAHGTSAHLNDSCETTAIKTVFGGHAYKLAVSSTKSMTGHLLGGAGGVEGVFTALALHDAFLPATVNLQEPDPELDLDYIPNHGRAAQVEYAMSDSLGFGGHNACVVFKRWEG